jgi:hypothetical protein
MKNEEIVMKYFHFLYFHFDCTETNFSSLPGVLTDYFLPYTVNGVVQGQKKREKVYN